MSLKNKIYPRLVGFDGLRYFRVIDLFKLKVYFKIPSQFLPAMQNLSLSFD